MMSEQHGESGLDQPRSAVKTVVKRSKKGCPECKKRKVKCDEQRPSCGQCQKSGRACHISNALFKPHALSSNVERAPLVSPNGSWQPADISLPTRDSHEEGFQPDETADDAETQSQPFNMPTSWSSPDLTPSRNARSAPFTQARPHSSASQPPWPMENRISEVREVPRSLSTDETSSAFDKFEELFFLRHFSENIAPWLDLVNFQRYFGHECIVLTRENPLLRFAMCALSAKQLGHSYKTAIATFPEATQTRNAQSLLQRNPSFLWYGAKYYDKAIRTLSKQIISGENLSHVSPSATSISGQSQDDVLAKASGEDPIVRLLAACLLIQYENLSGNTKGWTGHLDGFTKLLDLLNEGLPYPNPWSHRILDAKNQRALRAAYWWYIINDMEESFVAHRAVRADLDDTSLWKQMGLHIHDSGEIIDLDTSPTPDAPPHLQEDLLSFALIRLVSRLIDALATSPNRANAVHSTSYATLDPKLSDNVAKFHELQHHIDEWMSTATAAFIPDTTCYLGVAGNSQDIAMFRDEMWYSHSFRAVTMLYYHMAKTLLLMNQPLDMLKSQGMTFGQASDLLKVLRNIEGQIQSHAARIISIAQGMHFDGAVSVRAIQPLYVAGRSLTTTEDRRRLIEMIRSTQKEFGIVCEYRVEHLLQEWGVSFESLGLTRMEDRRGSVC